MTQNPTNPRRGWQASNQRGRKFVRARVVSHLFLSVCLSVRLSLEGWSHGSLLCEFLGVQGFSEGRGLVGVGGHYGGSVGDGVRRGSSVAGGWLQVLPCEQVCVAAG